jgi:hypothetical protein
MAYYFLFPEKDSTIYSHPDRTELNTGHDEILEIVKEKGSTNDLYYPSRVLIKFNNEEIQNTINNVIGLSTFNTTATCSLQLLSVEHKNLSRILNLELFAVSQSWDEGTGRYSNLPQTSTGCSWLYRDNSITKTLWPTSSAQVTGLTFASSSITIGEIPSSSAHQLTINGVDFIGVLSSSLFNSDNKEVYFNISGSTVAFNENLATAINASSSITSVSANASASVLTLSGSSAGTKGNVAITTSSISGNNQGIFQVGSSGYSLQGGTDQGASIFSSGTSGSINSSTGITQGGGSWYTGNDFNQAQQFINAASLDTNFDVTSIVKKHYNNIQLSSTYPTGIENHGFIIKQPDAIETNTSESFGEIKYFSVDTHTIYPPRLAFKWDDSTHNKQASAKQSGELNVSLYRNQEEYNQNAEAIFRIHVRDKYPIRQFASSSNYLNPGYFTTSSFYSVRDASTEEEIIPFDVCTKLSADEEGMFFKLYMNGLQPERYYRVLFKHTNNEGTRVYDDNYIFKVIR